MQHSKISVRRGTLKDAEAIVSWQVQMALETENKNLDLETVQKGVDYLMRNEALGEYLIAEVEGKPAASALLLKEWSDWRNGFVIWVHSVYVEESYRRSGVFSEIYSAIKSQVQRESLLKGIRLYVDKTNERAQKVYENLGMNGDHYRLFEWMKD